MKSYRKMTEAERKASCVEVVSSFYRSHNRVPTTSDVSATFIKRVRSHWGSWENGMKAVLQVKPGRHQWSDEEILQVLRDLRAKLNRFPKATDLENVKKSLRRHVTMRFGGLNNALEKGLHDSPRIQILKALRELTPPLCDSASTREIAALLQEKKTPLSTQEIGVHLDDARRAGYVDCKRYSETSAWWLTGLGKGLLEQWMMKDSK